MRPKASLAGRCFSLTLILLAGAAASGAGTSQFATPFRVESNGKPIDMALGSASPYIMDFDRDGVFDLLLGQRSECKLRIYRNTGSNKEPKFGVSAFFKAGGVDASLPGG
jgi:hypothetical protein